MVYTGADPGHLVRGRIHGSICATMLSLFVPHSLPVSVDAGMGGGGGTQSQDRWGGTVN